MSRKQVSQTFYPNNVYVPTKASLFLRAAGTANSYFEIATGQDAVIDAPNWATVTQNLFKILFGTTASDYTGTGYLFVLPPNATAPQIASATSLNNSPSFTYPIKATDDGLVYVHCRVKSSESSVRLYFTLDGKLATDYTFVPSGVWQWISTSFVAYDNEIRDLSLSPVCSDLQIDKIVLSKSPSVPTLYGPSYTSSPYCTAHARLCTVDGSYLPLVFLNTTSSNTTLAEIVKDGWYNFDLSEKTVDINGNSLSSSLYSYLGLVLDIAGTSDNHYLIWDIADSYVYSIATNTNGGGWVADTTVSMATRIYSDNPSINEYTCELTTPDAVLATQTTSDFSPTSLKGKHHNTVYVSNMAGGQWVEYDSSEKIVSFVIDQSGSGTWNDTENEKVTDAKTIVSTLDSIYPSDINYNLFEFKGEPAFSFFITLPRRITSNKVSDIIKAHFENDTNNFAGIRIVRKKDSYPTSFTDGEIVLDGFGMAALDTDLETQSNYFYTAFTYDQLLRPSRGIDLSLTTSNLSSTYGYNTPLLPYGLPDIKVSVLSGYDVRIDDNVVNLWNTDEGSGEHAFDFAQANPLSLSNTRWLDVFDSPAGISGLAFNGINSTAQSEYNSDCVLTSGQSKTFAFWINPNRYYTKEVVASRSEAGGFNYAILIDNGYVKFAYSASIIHACTQQLSMSQWYHVAIVINGNDASFYIDGVLVNTTTVVIPAIYTGSSYFTLGYDVSGTFANRFSGKLSHFSIHNINRDLSYIANIASPSHGSTNSGVPVPVDNGDRLVVLDYIVPDDLTYDTIRVVRNLSHMPSHENDGIVVTEFSALTLPSNANVLELPYAYDVGHTCYFRVFTKRDDVWCDIDDASKLNVFIPDVIRPDIVIDDVFGDSTSITPGAGDNPLVPIATNIQLRNGNEKVYLTWDMPSDPASRVVIYYSTEQCPYYDGKTKSIKGGTIIFDDTKTVTEFVHRKITNRKKGYYLIVPIDKFGSFNTSFQCQAGYPREDLDDSGIPLLEVSNLSYHLLDYDRVKITWDVPVTISSTASGWFDDTLYTYAAICDLYGNPIVLDFPDQVQAINSIGDVNQITIEDVFSLGLTNTTVDQLPRSNFAVNTDGLIVGTVKLAVNGLLSTIRSITFNSTMTYKLSDQFSFAFPAASILLNNPLSFVLTNRDNLYFNTADFVPPSGCSVNDESGGSGDEKSPNRRKVNGVFIRRKTPFAIRGTYKFKDNYVPLANVQAVVYDATGGPCAITPTITNPSQKTLLVSSTARTQSLQIPILDGDGVETGNTETISFSDILVKAPQLPQSATVFVKLQYNGYIAVQKMHIFFPTTLRLELNATAPLANNLDVREQFARAYLVDPDNPGSSNITYPADLTIAKWELIQSGTQNVSFYSTDSVPLTSGIYSYFRSGTARMIFFGPAQPNAAGTYNIKVSTTVLGLYADVTVPVTIDARPSGTVRPIIPNPKNPRILAEFPECVNYVWADGINYAKMTITRDPTPATYALHPERSNTKYANGFRSCAGTDPIIALPPNSVVNIIASGWEIIHGSVDEIVVDGQNQLSTGSATISMDTADVLIGKDPYTYVYFRRSDVIPDAGCKKANIASCVCTDAPEDICAKPYEIGKETEVIISSKINYLGKPLTIFGGGGRQFDGRPPTLLIPKEPLYVNCVGLFVDDTPVNDFVVDGVTVNYLYFEILYAGEPVPSNTEIIVTVVADRTTLNGLAVAEAISVPSKVYTTTTTNLPGGVVKENPVSLITVPVGPVPTGESIKFGVYITVNYNG